MASAVRGYARWGQLVGALSVLACGRAVDGSSENPDVGSRPMPPEVRAPEVPPEAEPAPAPHVPASEAPATEEIPLELPPDRLPDDPRRAPILGMLERECSGCHEGPSEERDRFLDLETLLSTGALRAGAGEASRLVLWLQYGDARREHAGVRVSAEELDTLVSFVNSFPAAYTCPGYESIDRDRAQELMLQDIMQRAPEDRPFIRYVGALRATPPDGCTGGPPGRRAFASLVNGLSTSPEVVNMSGVFEGDPIYAVDLRSFGWTLPIDVDGPEPRHFDDRWSAIVAAAGPYALELQGPEADALKQQTQAPVPMLTAAVFVAHASVGPLYAALVGVGSDVSALATSLGVDAELSRPLRAGLFGAAALPDRVVTRHEQGAFPGLAWWTREELRSSVDGVDADLARDPVHYPSAGSEIIFRLPNGLFAFAVAGADGRRLDEVPCTVDLPCTGPIRAVTSVTCRGCHGDGPYGVADEVLPYLEADATRYAPDLVPLIREQYRDDLGRTYDADQARSFAVYAAAGIGRGGTAVADLYHDFESHPLDADRAANDLGIQVAELRAAITALGATAAELAPLLSGGKIDRDLFTSHFQRLACAVEGPRNQPASCP